MSEEGPTDTLQVVDVPIGATGDTEPQVIRLSDILVQQESTVQKEEDDKMKLNPLVTPDLNGIRTKLIAWATQQFRGSCDLVTFAFNPPNPCSDGVTRNVYQYIEFLTGNTIVAHVGNLQAILPDFAVAYFCEGSVLRISVVKP